MEDLVTVMGSAHQCDVDPAPDVSARPRVGLSSLGGKAAGQAY